MIGLGRMGAAIARRFEAAGHSLFVWNRSPGASEEFAGRGATVLGSPREALLEAEVCITMLADSSAVEAVVLGPDGVLAGLGGGTTLVDMSTISDVSSALVADEAGRHGVEFLRAPVSGNPSVVAAGGLGIVVSGPRATFDRCSALLRDIGPHLFYVGEGEEARIVKLALNLVLGGTAELLAEALVLAEAHGIARRDLLEVIAGSAIGSPFVRYKTEALVAGDYSPTFSARLLAKDLDLALAAGRRASVTLPVTRLTEQLARQCIELGMGDDDLMVLVRRLRSEAGLE